jgi:CubicO group peptidase (beta-lactamase class C family)
VEKVSGKSFGEVLTTRILEPLGMSHTAYEPEAGDARIAEGYTMFALSDPERVEPEGRGWIAAAGGMFSTPTDLAKWNLALVSGRVLKPASYTLMTSRRRLNDGRWSDYGCGLRVTSQGGRDVLVHTGAVSGFNAYNATVPDTRSSVTVFVNLEGGLGSIPGDLLGLLLKVPAIIPEVEGPDAVEAAKALLAQYQAGKVERNRLSDEFNAFLTDARLAGAAERLKPFGTPREAQLVSRNERGGMEVSVTRLVFERGRLRTLMYRQPDGTVEQFFVYDD